MLLTLNSADQDNFNFINDLQETLLLKKGTVISVKNIKIEKAFQISVVAPDNTYQIIFDDAAAQPVTFTIPAGIYSLQTLEDALNASYDASIYGYNINWVIKPIDYTNKNGTVNFDVLGYQTLVSTGYQRQLFLTTALLTTLNSGADANGTIQKTIANASLTDNYLFYKASLNLNDVALTRAPTGGPVIPKNSTYSRFQFTCTGTNVRFALVRGDWTGDLSDATIKSIFCMDIVGVNRNFIVYENGNEIVNFSGGGTTRAVSLQAGNYFNIRVYNPVTGMTPEQKRWYGGFYLTTLDAGQGNPTLLTNYLRPQNDATRYFLSPGEQLFPVFINLDNTSSFNEISANLIESKPPLTDNETRAIVDHDFESLAECSITNDIITSAPTGAFTCGLVSGSENISSHHVFSITDKTKQVITGHFSTNTGTTITDLVNGYEFNNGNIKSITSGVISPTVSATFNNGDYFRLNKANNEVFLEKSTDAGATYTIIHMPFANGYHEDVSYVKFLFPSVANSTGSFVELIEMSLHNTFGLSATGKYVQLIFDPTISGFGQQLGFRQQDYTFDATAGAFPFNQAAEDDIEFNIYNTNLRDSYRIQLPNLPIKSYNGKTGFSDKTICTLDVAVDGAVSYPHEMKVECLNDYDIPLSEIQCQITDEDNNLASGKFLGDCQIALEITPHLAI
jgi:hypothetical protein